MGVGGRGVVGVTGMFQGPSSPLAEAAVCVYVCVCMCVHIIEYTCHVHFCHYLYFWRFIFYCATKSLDRNFYHFAATVSL